MSDCIYFHPVLTMCCSLFCLCLCRPSTCQWTLCTSWYLRQWDVLTPSCCRCPRHPTPSPLPRDISWSKTWWDPHVSARYSNTSSPFITDCVSMFPQVKTGIVMNILGILSVTLAMNTWGVAMFNLHEYPEWAHPINKSALATNLHFSSVQSLNATHWSLPPSL